MLVVTHRWKMSLIVPLVLAAGMLLAGMPGATGTAWANDSGIDRVRLEQPGGQQIIVRFAAGASQAERDAYLASLGGTVVREIEALNAVVVSVANEAVAEAPPTSPAVELAEPDHIVTVLDGPGEDVPNDPLFSEQWGLDVIHAPSGWAALPADAPTITVAVIDTGICAEHPDLQARVVAGWDFVDGDDTPQDAFGHGCAVSGIIAANSDNAIGIAGAAPNVQVLPLRVLDENGVGNYSDVAAALIDATDAGAQIINLSLGGEFPSTLLLDAVNYATRHGALVIAAAGNTGQATVMYPAAYDPVIAVAAVDQDLSLSSFSSYGPAVDVLAPGRDILSTQPDGSYERVSGTSFAAPHVAGVAALELGRGGTLTLDGGVVAVQGAVAESPVTDPSPDDTPPPVVNDPAADAAYRLLSNGQYVYGPNVADFSVAEYLESNQTALGSKTLDIYGRANYYSINPRVYLTVIEMATGLVTRADAPESEIANPLGLAGDSFLAQLDTLSEIMNAHYYRHLYDYSPQAASVRVLAPVALADGTLLDIPPATNAGTYALLAGLAAVPSIDLTVALDDSHPDGFRQTYARLFPADDPLSEANHIYVPGEVGYQAAPPDMLQLPYLRGETWTFNGVHNWTGTTGTDMSSIDFSKGWPSWGSDTSDMYVVAAAAGVPRRISDCYFRVTHSDGWETEYYHLEQARSLSGYVNQNQVVGVVANTQAEALCNGGFSTGPHVHFGLRRNGAYVPLDGELLSGWAVHAGRYAYDYDRDYMWLERDGVRKTVGYPLLNDTNGSLVPADVNFISNGTFNAGELGWGFTGSVSHQVVSGLLSIYQQAVPGSGASVYQVANQPLPANAPLEISLELGNSAAATKTATVLLHDPAWDDVITCSFAVAPGAPLGTYKVRAKTGVDWDAAVFSVFIEPADGKPTLWVDNVSMMYRPTLSVTGVECLSPASPANTNLLVNGEFASGTSGWIFAGSIVSQYSSGILYAYRALNSTTALTYQSAKVSLPAGAPLDVEIDLGNTSISRKVATVVLHNGDWSDAYLCRFVVPAGTPTRTYNMRFKTGQNWTRLIYAVYLDPADGRSAFVIDNASVRYLPSLSVPAGPATCTAPLAAPNVNMIENGTFNNGAAAWRAVKDIAWQVTNGMLLAYHKTGGTSAAWYQYSEHVLPAGAPYQLTLELGNSSSVSKRVDLVLHDPDWTDVQTCSFTLPARLPLTSFVMRGKTARAWPAVVPALYIWPADGQAAVQVDNIDMRYLPSLSVSGLSCGQVGAATAEAEPTPEPESESVAPPASTDAPLFGPGDVFERVEAESDILARSGDWTTFESELASGTGYIFSSGSLDDSLSLAFYGTGLEVIYVGHPALGSFMLEVDGEVMDTITTTTPDSQFDQRAVINGLDEHEHILRIVPVEGTVAIDALVVEGYFETSSSLD